MNENRKHGKKDEHNNPQNRGHMEYNIPPYGINENIPEGFAYSPHWASPNMGYGFSQYDYYSAHHPASQFQNNDMAPQPFIQEHFPPNATFEKPRARSHGKKKIKLEYIHGKNKRSVTFSKRKKGIMKKAYELNILTGTEILLLVASESGHVYTFATDKLKPIILEHENIIQSCLNRQDGAEYRSGASRECENQGSENAGYRQTDDPYKSTDDED